MLIYPNENIHHLALAWGELGHRVGPPLATDEP